MATHEQTIDEQIAKLPDNIWKLKQGLIENQTDDDQELPITDEPTDDESLAPWQSPQLTSISVSPTDKQIKRKDIFST